MQLYLFIAFFENDIESDCLDIGDYLLYILISRKKVIIKSKH